MGSYPFFVLPSVSRGWIPKLENPGAVSAPDHLPQRLFLGDLDASSFKAQSNGWSARYHDADGFAVDLNYENDLLTLRQQWHDLPEMFCGLTSRAATHLLKCAYTGGLRSEWEEYAQELITGTALVKYLVPEEHHTVLAGFPDGVLKTVACPIHLRQIETIVQLHREMQLSTDVRTFITGYVTLTSSLVRFRTNGRKSVEAYRDQAFDLFGLKPDPVTIVDGVPAFRRHHNMYVACVPFREMPRFVSKLVANGVLEPPFLGDTQRYGWVVPHGLEHVEGSYKASDPTGDFTVEYTRLSSSMEDFLEFKRSHVEAG